MGNAEKEDIHTVIANAVSVAVKDEMKKERKYTLGMYIILVGIFISIAWPMNDKLYNMNDKVHDMNAEVQKKANESYVTERFLTKQQYVFLEEDQNAVNTTVFKDHDQAERKYQELNIHNGRQLEVTWRTSKQVD
jgi:hypothetical protein